MRFELLIVSLNHLEHFQQHFHSILNVVNSVRMLPHVMRLTGPKKRACVAALFFAIDANEFSRFSMLQAHNDSLLWGLRQNLLLQHRFLLSWMVYFELQEFITPIALNLRSLILVSFLLYCFYVARLPKIIMVIWMLWEHQIKLILLRKFLWDLVKLELLVHCRHLVNLLAIIRRVSCKFLFKSVGCVKDRVRGGHILWLRSSYRLKSFLNNLRIFKIPTSRSLNIDVREG